ncbi:MAG: hypothetical protein Q8Q02_17115 [Nocardioides sp.]|nr:hypothetical protein [Nocardioides sp.]
MSSPGPSPRVRVTSPRATRRRAPRRTPAAEIDQQSALGDVYINSLLRAQLRLAGLVLLALALLVGSLPLVVIAFPALNEVIVLGMPLPWVVLGFAVYPVLALLGWVYVRTAERNEQAFTDVVERS